MKCKKCPYSELSRRIRLHYYCIFFMLILLKKKKIIKGLKVNLVVEICTCYTILCQY
jgi:hypothetical protein